MSCPRPFRRAHRNRVAPALAGLVAVVVAGVGVGCSGDPAASRPGVATSTSFRPPPFSVTPDGSLVMPDIGTDPLLSECSRLGHSYLTMITRAGLLAMGGSDADFATLDAQMADVGGRLPAELREEWAVVEKAYQEFSTKARGADLETAEGARRLAEATDIFGADAVERANDTINKWFTANCDDDTLTSIG